MAASQCRARFISQPLAAFRGQPISESTLRVVFCIVRSTIQKDRAPVGGRRFGTAGPFRFLFGHEKEGVHGKMAFPKKERTGAIPFLQEKTQNNTKPGAFPYTEGPGSLLAIGKKSKENPQKSGTIRGNHTPAGTAVSMDGAPPARSSAVTGAGASAGWFSRSRATASISLMRFSWLTRVALGS